MRMLLFIITDVFPEYNNFSDILCCFVGKLCIGTIERIGLPRSVCGQLRGASAGNDGADGEGGLVFSAAQNRQYKEKGV